MFRPTAAFSSFSTNDLDAARTFYGQTLRMDVQDSPQQGLELRVADGTPVFVYPKEDHEPATFTVLNFLVKSVDEAVDELTRAGVRVERYGEMAGMRPDERGVYRGNGPAIAWFKDPAGNILSVLETT
jgi:hypothetical protein